MVNICRKKPLWHVGIVASAAIALLILSGCSETLPEFRVSSLTITPEEIAVGESATVTVNIENVGEAEGTYHATLKTNEEVSETLDVTLAAQESRALSFGVIGDMPGIYNIDVEGLRGTLKVLKPAEFRVVSLATTPRQITVGESVRNTVIIENTGETEGVYHAVLVVNGQEKAAKDIPLAAGEKKTVYFEGTDHPPGTYRVEMGELASVFEVVPRPAEFSITSLTITPEEIVPGENSIVTASVENTGGSEGIYHATLVVNGVAVDTKDVPLAAGAKQTVSFQLTEDMPGTCEIKLGELTGALKILKPAEFRIVEHDINPNPAKVGEEICLSISVQNVGEAGGIYVATLIVDGIVEETKEITLGGGVTDSVLFTISRSSPGTFEVEVGDVKEVIEVIQPVRLPNGTYLLNTLSGGWGELNIENGLDLDAVVILAGYEEPETPLLAVYVRSEASFTIEGIKDGMYIIYFSLGEDWDEDSKRFIRETEYSRFEDELDFETTESTYTTYRITLHPVIGGSAETEGLNEDEFPALD